MSISLTANVDLPNADTSRRMRRLLLVLPFAPRSLEKCAHLLILERCQELGWACTVLVANSDHRDQSNGATQTVETDWHGLQIIRTASNNWRWRVGEQIHKLRPSAVQRQIKLGRWSLSRRLTKAADLMLRPVTWAIGFPDQFIAFKSEFCKQALREHRRVPFDVVASFYHPFSSHLVARRIARITNTPWVAFTQDFYSWPECLKEHRQDRLANSLKRRYERRVLSDANAVIAYSDNLVNYLQDLLPQTPVRLLAHCYDDEDFPPEGKTKQADSEVFRLLSMGLVAKTEERGLTMFFEAVGELLRSQQLDPNKFRVRFLGHGGEIVRDCASRTGCLEVTEIDRPVTHDQAMSELKRATCLLYQQSFWGMRRRLPEYFGARKPILAFPSYPDAMSERLLAEYGAACVAGNKESLKSTIVSWYEQYMANRVLQLGINEAFVDSFRASRRAAELDTILREFQNNQ